MTTSPAVQGVSSAIEFSKSHRASTFEYTGAINTSPAGGPFDKSSFRCFGTTATFEGKTSLLSVCESIDRDGDKTLSRFTTQSDGKVIREVIAGTGKYEGMTIADAVVQSIGPYPVVKPGAFQSCTHQTGLYKLR